MDILKCSINNLSNNENINERIYYGNNTIKQSKHRIDIWIILNESQIEEIEYSYYYNSINNSSISTLEISKFNNTHFIVLNKLGNDINGEISNNLILNFNDLIKYLKNFIKIYTLSIVTYKINNSYNNIVLYDLNNISLSKNFDDIKYNINKKYYKYKKKYININRKLNNENENIDNKLNNIDNKLNNIYNTQ